MAPILAVTVSPPRIRSMSASNSLRSARIRCAQVITRCPSAVNPSNRCPRSTITTSNSCSSLRIATDSVGWLTWHAAAARPKCRSRASATRYSSCWIDTSPCIGPTIAHRYHTMSHSKDQAIVDNHKSLLASQCRQRNSECACRQVYFAENPIGHTSRVRSLRPRNCKKGNHTMAKVVCVLYDDPVDGYPENFPRDGLPHLDEYPDGQTLPTPSAIDFTPGALLGSVSGELGLRKYLESQGHELVVTSDKDGDDSEFDKHLADAEIVISQPFWPAYLTAERIARAPKLKLALTAGIGSDHVDLDAAIKAGITVAEVTFCNSISVAEHVVMSILTQVRNYLPSNK